MYLSCSVGYVWHLLSNCILCSYIKQQQKRCAYIQTLLACASKKCILYIPKRGRQRGEEYVFLVIFRPRTSLFYYLVSYAAYSRFLCRNLITTQNTKLKAFVILTRVLCMMCTLSIDKMKAFLNYIFKKKQMSMSVIDDRARHVPSLYHNHLTSLDILHRYCRQNILSPTYLLYNKESTSEYYVLHRYCTQVILLPIPIYLLYNKENSKFQLTSLTSLCTVKITQQNTYFSLIKVCQDAE